MSLLIPKSNHAIIKVCKKLLSIDRDITSDDVELLKTKIQSHIDDGLSPADIKKIYSIEYTDFGMFIKNCLKMKIRTVKDSINNFYKKNNRSITDDKLLYKKQCAFKFDPYSISEIPGYGKLLNLGIYHPINNPKGVCRDHIVSVEFGWRNNINPAIISHYMNCQFITNEENIKKGATCHMTIDVLLSRIKEHNFTIKEKSFIHLPKSKTHRQKISETNSKFMTITNGYHNIRILKSSIIPEGYRRGMTRKNKMVVQPGFEPGNKIF